MSERKSTIQFLGTRPRRVARSLRPESGSMAIKYGYAENMDVSIAEAKNQLSQLVRAVESGEAVVITRNGRPVAQLVPAPAKRRKVRLGAMRGRIRFLPGWDAPIDLDAFSTAICESSSFNAEGFLLDTNIVLIALDAPRASLWCRPRGDPARVKRFERSRVLGSNSEGGERKAGCRRSSRVVGGSAVCALRYLAAPSTRTYCRAPQYPVSSQRSVRSRPYCASGVIGRAGGSLSRW